MRDGSASRKRRNGLGVSREGHYNAIRAGRLKSGIHEVTRRALRIGARGLMQFIRSPKAGGYSEKYCEGLFTTFMLWAFIAGMLAGAFLASGGARLLKLHWIRS